MATMILMMHPSMLPHLHPGEVLPLVGLAIAGAFAIALQRLAARK